jgi:hypothetical protein
LRRYIAHLTSDIATAHKTELPLGATIWLHSKLLKKSSEQITPADIAFDLSLPILQGVPIETLIKIRRDEHESFQRFRDALRFAVKEQLKINESGHTRELSEQLRKDTIEPELRRIRDRLLAVEKTLTNKTAVGVFLGALITTCGILAGVPGSTSVAAGIGTMVTVEAGAANKYLEEKEQISLSDMYFLWQAVKHLAHNL